MKIIRNPKQLRKILEAARGRGKKIGFVPTMGALHEGHLSLIRASNRENDVTVASIFVNPTQFGPKEDFKKYPRVFGQDKRLLQKAGTDILFYPSVRAMYPKGLAKPTRTQGAKWPALAKGLCGRFRPGHFQGVVTVVTKLLDAVRPHRLYLGAKDYQQAMVLTQLVKDLDLKINVRVMPTVREKDGLAMSSRNRYLSRLERARAKMISRCLFNLRAELMVRGASIPALKAKARRSLQHFVDRVQYLEVVDAKTLAPLTKPLERMVALAACFVGKTRLIDNVIIRIH